MIDAFIVILDVYKTKSSTFNKFFVFFGVFLTVKSVMILPNLFLTYACQTIIILKNPKTKSEININYTHFQTIKTKLKRETHFGN